MVKTRCTSATNSGGVNVADVAANPNTPRTTRGSLDTFASASQGNNFQWSSANSANISPVSPAYRG